MVKSILVFLSGSAEPRKAFDLGLEIAMGYQARLVLLNVLPAREFEALLERNEDYPVDKLRRLCQEARDKGVPSQYRTAVGDKVNQIIRAADDHEASLIIIGGTQVPWSQSSNYQLRTEQLIRKAHCPVTLV